jgi:hypothetical protein
MTFFYKRVFPFLIFPVFIAAGFITAAKSGADLSLLLFFVFVLIIGYAGMKLIGLFDLVDEVLDAGDALIVRNSGREERVPLADIIDVSYTQPTFGRPQLGHPHPVTLRLRRPSQFGDQLSFFPRVTFWGKGAVIEELNRRIHVAREASDAR